MPSIDRTRDLASMAATIVAALIARESVREELDGEHLARQAVFIAEDIFRRIEPQPKPYRAAGTPSPSDVMSAIAAEIMNADVDPDEVGEGSKARQLAALVLSYHT